MEPILLASSTGDRLERIARTIFFFALALLPIFVIPVAWFPFLPGKLVMFVSLVFCAFVLLLLTWVRRKRVSLPHARYLLLALVLPAVYVVSALFSIDKKLSFIGRGGEVDSVYFAVLLFMTLFLSFVYISRREHIWKLFGFLAYASGVALLFQIVQLIYGGSIFGLSVFSTPSANIVGSWNDFGIFASVSAIISLALLQRGLLSRWRTIGATFLLLISLGFVSIVNLNVTWWVIGVCSIAIAYASYRAQSARAKAFLQALPAVAGAPIARPRVRPFKNTWKSLGVALVCAVFIVWGSTLSSALSSRLGIAEIEARPSVVSTYSVARAVYAQNWYRAVLGSGPNTFEYDWVSYKPTQINYSLFWNAVFNTGFSFVLTTFVTVGLIAGSGMLLLILGFLILGARVWRRSDYRLDSAALAAFFGAAAIAVFACVFPVNQTALLLGIVLAGAFLAIGAPRASLEISFADLWGKIKGFLCMGIVALALVAGLAYAVKFYVAGIYLNKAGYELSIGDLSAAERDTLRSMRFYTTKENARFLVTLSVARLNQVLSDTSGTEQQQKVAFEAALKTAVDRAQSAVVRSPNSYAEWGVVASIYELLASVQVQGAPKPAQQFLDEAIARAPYDPSLHLRLARVYAYEGNYEGLRKEVDQALALKPNYTDAVLFLAQIEANRKNIPGAIQAASAAVQIDPSNPGLWFTLGLIEYSANNMKDAASALEQAVLRAPDYANAKYFLGLAYAALGRRAEATALFSDLAKANPDNTEVALILKNITEGKDPFAGAVPPVTTQPEKRSTPPIKE